MILYEFTWFYKSLHEFTWVYMSLHELTWVYMSLRELTWVNMSLHDFTWVYMSLHDFIWVHMILHEFTWVYKSLHEFTWVELGMFSQVTDVSFMIDSLPQLRVLDLGRNLIEDIPFGALRGYPRLEKLLLSRNQIGELSQVQYSTHRSQGTITDR